MPEAKGGPMTRRIIPILCIGAAIGLSATSCQKLPASHQLEATARGELPIEATRFLDAVPADYGDLIGVTSNADVPAWSQAWFMRPDKSIVVLWINASTGKIYDKVLVIPRR